MAWETQGISPIREVRRAGVRTCCTTVPTGQLQADVSAPEEYDLPACAPAKNNAMVTKGVVDAKAAGHLCQLWLRLVSAQAEALSTAL